MSNNAASQLQSLLTSDMSFLNPPGGVRNVQVLGNKTVRNLTTAYPTQFFFFYGFI